MIEEQLNEKVQRYEMLTKNALGKTETAKGLKGKQKDIAEYFLEMARNYFFDAKHFREKGDLVNALAALSYAYGWIDAGIKAEILKIKEQD